MSEEVLMLGDEAVHGEAAYSFGDIPLLDRHGEPNNHHHHHHDEETPPESTSEMGKGPKVSDRVEEGQTHQVL